MKGYRLLALSGCVLALAALAPANAAALKRPAPHRAVHIGPQIRHKRPLHAQTGKASVYSRRFQGHRTASGERFSSASNIAASKTLPLGTRARVINLETGRSAIIRIMDRGPHVRGRIVDLTPATARQLGMGDQGLALVKVEPLWGEPIHSVEHG